MNKVPVIIIGGDHHNTLAVIRCLGAEKIPIKIIIHKNDKDIRKIGLRNSKYIKYLEVISETEQELMKCLNKNVEITKQVLFPCSDFAALIIDRNYRYLKQNFYFPCFLNNPGRIEYMMDKYNQKKWADKNNILMAETWQINLRESKQPSKDILYPCIVKPAISAEGSKNDIEICRNIHELNHTLETYTRKRYNNVIVQQFLIKSYEVCAFGVLTKDGHSYGAIVKKIRENPPFGGGSLTFAQYIEDSKVESKIKDILIRLNNDGYVGMYDIELLVCNDKIYLNEINFRHSGNGYSLIKNGIKAPYIFYLSIIDSNKNQKYNLKNKKLYFIDEFNEWDSYRKKYISFKEMLMDYFKASSYAKFSLSDFYCSITYLFDKIFGSAKRHGR